MPLRNLSAGQACLDWQPWGKYLGIGSILGQSLIQSIAYILLSVRAFPHFVKSITTSIHLQTAFASSAAILVISYAP
jgi:chloride channel 3/4/5